MKKSFDEPKKITRKRYFIEEILYRDTQGLIRRIQYEAYRG